MALEKPYHNDNFYPLIIHWFDRCFGIGKTIGFFLKETIEKTIKKYKKNSFTTFITKLMCIILNINRIKLPGIWRIFNIDRQKI